MSGFLRLFRQFIGRALYQEKLRAGLATLGIALGVAVMVAIRLANQSVTDSFRAAVDAVGGSVSLRVVDRSGVLDERRLAELVWLQQFGTVSPVLENYAMVIPRVSQFGETSAADARSEQGQSLDRGELLYVMGVDVLRDAPLRKYELLALDSARRDPQPRELLNLIADHRSVILTEQFARRRGYRVGDRIRLAFGSRQQSLVVRGLLLDEGPARTLNGNFALMDIASAQWVSGRLGELDYLDLQLPPDGDRNAARREIAGRLPGNLTVEEPSEQAGRTETMIAAFQFNLAALSSVALLVGLLLIYNTVSVSVAARRDEVGVLRAVGAGGGTVAGLFLGEAALLGGLGAMLGLPLGGYLAQGAVQATAQTVETFYIATVAESTAARSVLPAGDAVIIVAIAVGLAMLAALIPALQATHVDPVTMIRGTPPVARDARRYHLLLLGTLLSALAGIALTQLNPVAGRPVFGFLAELFFMVSAALLTPLVLTLVCRALRNYLSRCLPVGRLTCKLASANLLSAVPQTSISVAALAMSLGMMIAIGVMVGSFRQTVVYWLDSILTADLVVKPVMNNSALSTGSLDPQVAQALREDPDVAATCWYSSRPLAYGDAQVRLDTSDLEPLLTHGRILFKSPRDATRRIIHDLHQQRPFVLVSESFALRYDKRVGDQVELATARGPKRYPIRGIYFDYASNQGTVLLDYALYRRDFQDDRAARAPLGISMYLRPGADPESVRQRLQRQFATSQSLYFVTNDRIRSEALRVFESTFAITYALQSIAILIAGAGVMATLARLIYERQKEIGLLSLVGASPGQLKRMIVIEATIIGTVSQLLGIAVGLVLSVVLIYVINVQSFGWTIQFHLPGVFLLQSTLAIAAASAAFGTIPARRAAGIEALHTVREL